MAYSPSAFVLSLEGQAAQRQIWDETLALLKKEAPDADIPTLDK
jgi:retinol dehydrogenase-12